tara:strand:- start:3100 stop:3855 length:756 start_codon:yes stop_codon:yes gene_type:complete
MALNKNFLFSSVGDNTNFDELWINSNMNYDIYVIYYGDNDNIFEKYKKKVKFIEKRKGSKFQNFKYFYDKYNDIINNYERFFILDDDIIINVENINEMFNISYKYKLDICAPSFTHDSKISYNITKHVNNVLLSYTNFVEVNTPLFSKISLDKLMKLLDYSLIGWGIDYLYIIANGLHKKKSYAIIHKVTCKNPHDNTKKNKIRELSNIKNWKHREKYWKEFAQKNNIIEIINNIRVFSNINIKFENNLIL